MSKHTPGPWMANHDGDSDLRVRAGDVCVVGGCGCCGSPYGDNLEADARLIAAAPDLLFQLLAASNYIDALGGDSKSYRQAIAKATGE